MHTGRDDTDPLRERLLAHSDHRAVRAVFQARTGGPAPDLTDLVETTRATDGEVALVCQDGVADVYVRWNGSRFEHLSVWPPWTITNYDHADRSAIEAYLADKTNVRPTPLDGTPFASPSTLSSLGHHLLP
jgi:hypothetical protein